MPRGQRLFMDSTTSGSSSAAGGDRDANGYRVTVDSGVQGSRGSQAGAAGPRIGPLIRADVVDVYIVRAAGDRNDDGAWSEAPAGSSGSSPADIELLQLQRTKDPLRGSWQPVMGHIEAGETAVQAAMREMAEEVGLRVTFAKAGRSGGVGGGEGGTDPACLGVWALEQVHPFYIAAIDCIVLSPRFVVLVSRDWQPKLNSEHGASRWVHARAAGSHFTWPGQLAAIAELRSVLNPAHPGHELLRLK